MSAGEELRQAAGKLRGWVVEALPQSWAPGAVERFGPELADWLESVADRHFIEDVTVIYSKTHAGPGQYETCGLCSTHDNDQMWPCPDVEHALALGRQILGEVSP